MMELLRFPAVRFEKNNAEAVEEEVCIEEDYHLYLNDKSITTLTASPSHLEELGAGHVVCQGLAEKVKNVRVSGKKIYVCADEPDSPKATSNIATSNIKIGAGDVLKFAGAVESELWKKTGGVHCCALFSRKKLAVRTCDVGRHNAFDKAAGYALLNGIDLSKCAAACTGRQPRDMVLKAANAGIPIIISRAAPTNGGIVAADNAGITLICFARGGRFNVYTHAKRIKNLKL